MAFRFRVSKEYILDQISGWESEVEDFGENSDSDDDWQQSFQVYLVELMPYFSNSNFKNYCIKFLVMPS